MSRTRVMPEDLMQMVVTADLYRSRDIGGNVLPIAAPERHARLETWFNLLGLFIGQLYVLLPWPLRWRADQGVNFSLARGRTAPPANFASVRQEAVALAQRLRQETNQWPAMMVFTSHPPTVGSLEWLRFELVRQGLLLANAVVDVSHGGFAYHPRPEAFLAIDPYALDTLSTAVAGLYSGFIRRIYLAWDRESRTQGGWQRHLFLRATGYSRIVWRLLGRLKRGIPVVMVLPGGLPPNARLFYTAREFVLRLAVTHWPYSKRVAQQKWMDVLMRPVNGTRPCDQGELPEATRAGLQTLLAEWGITGSGQEQALADFAREFAQEVPYRTRLFRVLMQRLVMRGKPLLWMAVSHRDKEPYVQVSSPWGAFCDRQGRLQMLKGSSGALEPASDVQAIAQAFSAQFSL